MTIIVKLTCPKCNTHLTINNHTDLERKKVTCPRCKTTSSIADFKPQCIESDLSTKISNSWYNPTYKIGYLVYSQNEEIQIFRLKEGFNCIGRQSDSHYEGTIQIIDASMTLSREHFHINVVKIGECFEHRISLASDSVNTTLLNGLPLFPEDIIVLNYGDTILCHSHRFDFVEQY